MKTQERWIWAGAIVLVDLLVFALPITAILAAYVLIVKPLWFRQWVDRVYSD